MSRKTPLLLAIIPYFALIASSGNASAAASLHPDAELQPAPTNSQLIIYHAGSLSASFKKVEDAFMEANPGLKIVDKALGSVDMIRRVSVGGEQADIVATADYTNIDLLLKPQYAAYTIRFAESGMVLLYRVNSSNLAGKSPCIVANSQSFDLTSKPPAVPEATPQWFKCLTADGVKIAGADPNADPGGYRALLMMQLAQEFYHKPGLYQAMAANYSRANTANSQSESYDYRFLYESSAVKLAMADPQIRFVHLPPEIALSDSSKNSFYNKASVTISGLSPSDPQVKIPGTRVTWGITILSRSKNATNAVAFLRFLLAPEKGGALQKASGPQPILPAVVSNEDYSKLPEELRPLVEREGTK